MLLDRLDLNYDDEDRLNAIRVIIRKLAAMAVVVELTNEEK
jgi:hypothetical protein